ncbi:MAG: glycosyltransferase family 2 protein [Phycisphaerae bacterium]|nr:glycosyltransferase family 2 protein [Phycisphaerae bacterium]
MRTLLAIPVYNEEKYVPRVIALALQYADDILVVDDGSSDRTPQLIAHYPVDAIRHGVNRGYGRSLRDAFSIAACRGFDWVITMDCDEQHEPRLIPTFLAEARSDRYDVISGSRYLREADARDNPPPDRRAINAEITREINERLALNLTDSFCGFKAFRVSALARLRLSEDGYAFPMQFWVQAAAAELRITEIPVTLIYNDPTRTFGGPLNDAGQRLAHYRNVLHCELERCASRLPAAALSGVSAGCGCGTP